MSRSLGACVQAMESPNVRIPPKLRTSRARSSGISRINRSGDVCTIDSTPKKRRWENWDDL
ncbi:hypothetical protein DL93DRAFT_2090376, partial [Clavulina sp. PMI_390]